MKLFACLFWVSIDDGGIAWTAWDNFAWQGGVAKTIESFNNFENRGGLAGAEIVDFDALMHVTDGGNVAAGKIDNVDKIAHAGAVGGIIIVAIDRKIRNLAGMNLHDDGHEIVRAVHGVLAEQARWVRANRIKIAQNSNFKTRIRGCGIGKNLFDHVFGLTIRTSDTLTGWVVFGELDAILVTVNGGGRREDDSVHVIFLH